MSSPQVVEAAIRSYDRAVDLQYVQLLLAIVVVILILYFVGCYFGVITPTSSLAAVVSAPATGISAPAAAPPKAPTPPAPAEPKKERFAPYASILVPDIQRSDTQFDRSLRTARPDLYDQRSSENMLFNDLHVTQLITPLY